MSFFEGLFESGQQADAARTSRDRNALYADNLLLDQEKRAQENQVKKTSEIYKNASAGNFLDGSRLGLGAGFQEALKRGDKNGINLAITMLNESDIVTDGARVTGLTRDNVNGGYLIDVTNADGSPGVKTENGTKDPDDPAIFIPDSKILDTVNTAWDSSVMAYQNEIGVSVMGATENLINANAGANAEEIEAQRALRVLTGKVLNAFPKGAAKTQAMGVVAAANTPEEKLEVVNEMAKDQGLEPLTPPKQTGVDLTDAQNEQVALRKAQAQTSGDGKMLKGNEALYNAVEQVESGGDHSAVSPAGAQGVMQLMPATAKNPGYGIEGVKDDSEAENRRVGREYLDAMLKKYNGNVAHALAAYNQGPKATDDWIAAGADPDKMPGGKETREYADKVFAQMGGKPTADPAPPEKPSPVVMDIKNFDPDIDYSKEELRELSGNKVTGIPSIYTNLNQRIQADKEALANTRSESEYQKINKRLEENKKRFSALVARDNPESAPAPEPELTKNQQRRVTAIDAQLKRNITDANRQKLEAEKAEIEDSIKPKEEEETVEPKITSSNNAVQQQFDDFAKVSEGKTNDELADMIISGEVNLSPQARQQVAEKLQAEGIQTLEDMRRLNNKDRALALAALASTVNSGTAGSNAGMGTEAAALRQQVLGLITPGIGQAIGPKDFAVIQQRREAADKTLGLQVKKFNAEQKQAAIGYADDLVNGVAEIMGDDELGDLGERSDMVLQSGILNTFWNKLSAFNAKDNPEEHKLLMKSANMVFSQIAAGQASKDEGGIWETIASLIRPDAEDNVGASDQFLSRVIYNQAEGQITYITEPTLVNGQWNYKPASEAFSVKDVLNANSVAGNFLLKAAKANTARYGLPQ
jgi:soluble lytic murein transglycosylase-like protein